MDEYDRIIERLQITTGSVYVYGSYAKNTLIRGSSDLDVLIFTERPCETLNELMQLKISEIFRYRFDVILYMPGMDGLYKLHAYLATIQGERISGENVTLNISDEELRRLIIISASNVFGQMLRIAYYYSSYPNYIDYKREKLADYLLSLGLLYLVYNGYKDITKPEIIEYEDEFEPQAYKALSRAFRYKYGYVRKGSEDDLISAAELIMKSFK